MGGIGFENSTGGWSSRQMKCFEKRKKYIAGSVENTLLEYLLKVYCNKTLLTYLQLKMLHEKTSLAAFGPQTADPQFAPDCSTIT